MNKKELMVQAHKMTKEIKVQYPNVDYKFQLGLCMSYLLNNKEDMKMVELKGSEKQVAWAKEIKKIVIECAQRNLDLKQAFYDEKPGRIKARMLNEAKELFERMQNEDSAKFFIENFAFLQKQKRVAIELAKEIEGVDAINEVTDRFLDAVERI